MEKTKLSHIAYEMLREDIMNLKLDPGSVLYELQLSREMNISRTPIRIALQKLASEGLVEIKTGKKNYFYVARLLISTFREIYQLRNALECLSVELASLNQTPEDIRALHSIIDEQEHLIENNASLKCLLDIDRRFHRKIAMASKNSMVAEQIDKMIDLYYRYNYFALSSNNRLKQVINEHRQLLSEIESGNLEAAKNLMNIHLSKSNENILFELANIKDME